MFAMKNAVDPLSPALRESVETARSFVPLKSLRHGYLEDLLQYAHYQSVFRGQVIFEQGIYDQQYIYLKSGKVRLCYASGHEELIDAADHILPLSNQQPRACKAVALEDCSVLRIDSDRLDRTLSWSQTTDYLISKLAIDRKNDGELDWFKAILASNLFFKVPSVNAEQIFSRLVSLIVSAGDVIVRQGDIGDACYFLKEGVADILKQKVGKPECVAQIVPGRCFGEDALVDSQPRNASVMMQSDGILMRLEKPDFLRLLKEPAVETIQMKALDEQTIPATLIDVRTEAEYHEGHLAYSANIPLSLLAMKKRLLALEEAYVLYCDSGRRSVAATYFLGKEGYNVVCLDGGLQRQHLHEYIVSEPSYLLRQGKLISPSPNK